MTERLNFLIIGCEGFVEALDIDVLDSPDDDAPEQIQILGTSSGLPPCYRLLRRIGVYPAGCVALDVARHHDGVVNDAIRDAFRSGRGRTALYREVRRSPLQLES